MTMFVRINDTIINIDAIRYITKIPKGIKVILREGDTYFTFTHYETESLRDAVFYELEKKLTKE